MYVVALNLVKVADKRDRSPLAVATRFNPEESSAFFIEREMSAIPFLAGHSLAPDPIAVMDTIRVLVDHGHVSAAEMADGETPRSIALSRYAFPFEEPFIYMIKSTDASHTMELFAVATALRGRSDFIAFDHCYQVYAHLATFDTVKRNANLLNKVLVEAALLVWLFSEAYDGREHARLTKLTTLLETIIRLGVDIHSDGFGLGGDSTALDRVTGFRFSNNQDAKFVSFVTRWWFSMLVHEGINLAQYVEKERGYTSRWCKGFRPVRAKDLKPGSKRIDTHCVVDKTCVLCILEIYQSQVDAVDICWVYTPRLQEAADDTQEASRTVWSDPRIEQRRRRQAQFERQNAEKRLVNLEASRLMPGTWID